MKLLRLIVLINMLFNAYNSYAMELSTQTTQEVIPTTVKESTTYEHDWKEHLNSFSWDEEYTGEEPFVWKKNWYDEAIKLANTIMNEGGATADTLISEFENSINKALEEKNRSATDESKTLNEKAAQQLIDNFKNAVKSEEKPTEEAKKEELPASIETIEEKKEEPSVEEPSAMATESTDLSESEKAEANKKKLETEWKNCLESLKKEDKEAEINVLVEKATSIAKEIVTLSSPVIEKRILKEQFSEAIKLALRACSAEALLMSEKNEECNKKEDAINTKIIAFNLQLDAVIIAPTQKTAEEQIMEELNEIRTAGERKKIETAMQEQKKEQEQHKQQLEEQQKQLKEQQRKIEQLEAEKGITTQEIQSPIELSTQQTGQQQVTRTIQQPTQESDATSTARKELLKLAVLNKIKEQKETVQPGILSSLGYFVPQTVKAIFGYETEEEKNKKALEKEKEEQEKIIKQFKLADDPRQTDKLEAYLAFEKLLLALYDKNNWSENKLKNELGKEIKDSATQLMTYGMLTEKEISDLLVEEIKLFNVSINGATVIKPLIDDLEKMHLWNEDIKTLSTKGANWDADTERPSQKWKDKALETFKNIKNAEDREAAKQALITALSKKYQMEGVENKIVGNSLKTRLQQVSDFVNAFIQQARTV